MHADFVAGERPIGERHANQPSDAWQSPMPVVHVGPTAHELHALWATLMTCPSSDDLGQVS